MYENVIFSFFQNLLNMLKRITMFKYLLFVFLFFSTDSFAYNYVFYESHTNGVNYPISYPWNSSQPIVYDGGSSLIFYKVTISPTSQAIGTGTITTYNRIFTACPTGTSPDSYGICMPPPFVYL